MKQEKLFEELFPSLNKRDRFMCADENCIGDEYCEQYRITDIKETCLDKQKVRETVKKLIEEKTKYVEEFKAGRLVALSELIKELGM